MSITQNTVCILSLIFFLVPFTLSAQGTSVSDYLDKEDLEYIYNYTLHYPIHSNFNDYVVHLANFGDVQLTKDKVALKFSTDTSISINSFFTRKIAPIDSGEYFLDLGVPPAPINQHCLPEYEFVKGGVKTDQVKDWELSLIRSNILKFDSTYYFGIDACITEKESGISHHHSLIFQFKKKTDSSFVEFEKLFLDYELMFLTVHYELSDYKDRPAPPSDEISLSIYSRVINLKNSRIISGPKQK